MVSEAPFHPTEHHHFTPISQLCIFALLKPAWNNKRHLLLPLKLSISLPQLCPPLELKE